MRSASPVGADGAFGARTQAARVRAHSGRKGWRRRWVGRWHCWRARPTRIGLELHTAAPRHFVAITDEVPGGLRPTDLELTGVATGEVTRIADTGSKVFRTRRLDPRRPRFYASYVPAGTHVVHYFARVGNTGDYLAAPAVAELMYGEATYARTAAERVRIATPSR